ncbi:unnamed protein product [Albugo candida]|uniref:Uncharacterized protein n=1 Tax=Albugo candida TaxID=65357 RepID=A0A024GQ69_9STRA|nr:unnamed protein product [Albugo candida]|eukprot:CCI48880.1 unnamed protein product [Albugo candida]
MKRAFEKKLFGHIVFKQLYRRVMDNFLLHFSSRFICFGWKMKWDSLNLLVESKKLYLSPETSHRLDFFEHNKGLGPFSFRWVMNHVPIFQVPVVAFEPEQCKSWLVIEDLDVEIHFGGSKHTDQNPIQIVLDLLKGICTQHKIRKWSLSSRLRALVKFIKSSTPYIDLASLIIFHEKLELIHITARSFYREGDTCILLTEDSKKDDNEWILGSSIFRSYQPDIL